MRWSVIEEDEFNVSTDKIYIYIYKVLTILKSIKHRTDFQFLPRLAVKCDLIELLV